MKAKDFAKKLTAAKPGSWIEYYFGFLYADRQVDKAIDALGRAVFGAHKDGLVALVQRRDGTGCRYYAVKL